jgi:SAM-dependent methyltransferase
VVGTLPIHHAELEMHIDNAHWRLASLWGEIDRQHNELIAKRLSGKRILDVGCGYGSLVAYLGDCGLDAEGVDYDKASVEIAHSLFPCARVRKTNAEDLADYADHSFDSIVLKDCMHHLVGEGDVDRAFESFRRVLGPSGRIVILDPNPTLIVRTARKLISHIDPEASLKCTLGVLEKHGFVLRGVAFYETVGLPLSGGYVGVRLVPNVRALNGLVSGLNRVLSGFVNACHLGRQFCWRYVVDADVT